MFPDYKRGLLALLQQWLRSTNIMLLDIIHQPLFIKNAKRFGGWFLFPSSGGTYSGGLSR
jgi:hypothetical protein